MLQCCKEVLLAYTLLHNVNVKIFLLPLFLRNGGHEVMCACMKITLHMYKLGNVAYVIA